MFSALFWAQILQLPTVDTGLIAASTPSIRVPGAFVCALCVAITAIVNSKFRRLLEQDLEIRSSILAI